MNPQITAEEAKESYRVVISTPVRTHREQVEYIQRLHGYVDANGRQGIDQRC